MNELFCFGLGYSATALARRITPKGWHIAGTTTDAAKAPALTQQGYSVFLFDGRTRNDEAAKALASATHILLSIPPDAVGDPALRHYADAIATSKTISWIGYLSSVGVYGNANGGWVDEATPPNPRTTRGLRRWHAETGWLDFGKKSGKTVVIFRLPGIYGPGRSAIDQLRAGTARRIIKPGQIFNRIHVEDIAGAVEAALGIGPGAHVFNITDDLPSPPQDVIAYGAELLGLPCPPAIDAAEADLSATARSFYIESKKVSNARMKAELGFLPAYPTYVEGLQAIARGTQ